MAALFQYGEAGKGLLHVQRQLGFVSAYIGAQAQILFGRQGRKSASPLRHVGDAHAHHVLGRLAHQLLAVKHNAAAGFDGLTQAAQCGGFARAIGTQNRGDVADFEGKIDVVQHLGGTIGRVQAIDFKQARHLR